MIHTRKKMVVAIVLVCALAGCQGERSSSPASANTPVVDGASVTMTGSGFDKTLQDAIVLVEDQMAQPLTVPVPKDPGGGYTHEQHKQNALLIYTAAQLYTFTDETKYAEFAGKVMLQYADVYPDWDLHPAQKEQSPGRMFWQNLNESWWLVHVAQAYEAVSATLSESQRQTIETRLLRNMAEFLSDGSPTTFNKIHNHGTWATAAVGLTGYAIGDQSYVEQALLGLDKSGDTGFLKQLDQLFSPDGYYNEGPYYQRYALMPFVIFGQNVQRNNPEQAIFEHRDGILKKAIFSTIQQSYGGLFFPINDALKDKGIATTELLHGVAIAYSLTGDKGLLSIAQAQDKFVLTQDSQKLAADLAAGKAEPFNYASMRLRDGADGTAGALDILRSSSDPKSTTVVMKNTSQGLGHGHFDKLGFVLYDNGHEIISDYGAARFLNIEAKYGGHYLAENNAFAKQTIAHNALVVDEQSHFSGNTSIGNQHHPKADLFKSDKHIKIASASIDTAYEGVSMKRTMAIVSDAAFKMPIVIDLLEVDSNTQHTYDLPYYYQGQFIESNLAIDANTQTRRPLGEKNGYQYLWNVAVGGVDNDFAKLTWLYGNRFYTLSSIVPPNSEVIFAEIGANDPDFNLRRETAAIIRTANASNARYVSVIEPHGEYNPIVEYTRDSHSQIQSIKHYEQDSNDLVVIKTTSDQRIMLALSNNADESLEHMIVADGQSVKWKGPYKLFPAQ